MWRDPQFPVDLVTFTKEILNGKLHFFVQCHHIQVLRLVHVILLLALLLQNIQVKECFKKIRFLSKVNKFINLLNTFCFWLALKQIFAVWLSNLALLSIVTLKSLSSLLSQVLSSPSFAEHFQVFHSIQKGSCHQKNYKCLCHVKKKRSFT